MKMYGIKIVLFSTFLLSMSCSTMRYNINKNNKFTEKQIINLLQKNGNAFYLSSTYAPFSTVWTYSINGIEIYRLAKGKVNQKEIFSETELIHYTKITFEDVEKELYQKCALELDGDMFGFRVDVDGKIQKEEYGIDIKCLKKGIYKSNFLNKIVTDIKTYNMWGVNYQ